MISTYEVNIFRSMLWQNFENFTEYNIPVTCEHSIRIPVRWLQSSNPIY